MTLIRTIALWLSTRLLYERMETSIMKASLLSFSRELVNSVKYLSYLTKMSKILIPEIASANFWKR